MRKICFLTSFKPTKSFLFSCSISWQVKHDAPSLLSFLSSFSKCCQCDYLHYLDMYGGCLCQIIPQFLLRQTTVFPRSPKTYIRKNLLLKLFPVWAFLCQGLLQYFHGYCLLF